MPAVSRDMEDALQTDNSNTSSFLDDAEVGYRKSARWRLQNKRQSLNQRIYKQSKLRDGAENLAKALRITNDRRVKEAAMSELSFANSQLDVLKDELEGINSTLDVYQFDRNTEKQIPMIPLGLRETKELLFKDQFRDFISEHYSEESGKYDDELDRLESLRKRAVMNVSRDKSGIQCLYEYYNQLYFIEKKFFPKAGGMSVYFHWFDTTTGLPKLQRSIAFEKASIMFNIGALWSQIGTKQERENGESLDIALESFQKAAGAMSYIRKNFINSPSVDMTQDTLNMLAKLMLAQAQACIWERCDVDGNKDSFIECITAAQNCAEVSDSYRSAHVMMKGVVCMDFIPLSWANLATILNLHYKALSHYYTACGLLQYPAERTDDSLDSWMQALDISEPENRVTRKKQAKAHIHSALRSHEEAMKLRQICRHCRKMNGLLKALREARERTTTKLVDMEEEDDFDSPVTPSTLKGLAKQRAVGIPPDFRQFSVEDLFHGMGPVNMFNADSDWSLPRSVLIKRTSGEFGFSVIGAAPVIVQSLDEKGPAKKAGVLVGDVVIGVNNEDVKWGDHADVVNLIRKAHTEVTLTLVSPFSVTAIAAHYNLQLRLESDTDSSIRSDNSSSSSGIGSAGSSSEVSSRRDAYGAVRRGHVSTIW